ncbi:MAG: protein-glutamate O-methyltransferase CheR [Candidatus Dadabacteria bacterium]|nr:MAG: protein-glutamate O-methyltransferase CheR [Candidatus Dadabacteria bacterium]
MEIITLDNFRFVADLLHQKTGIVLSDEKVYFVETRLSDLLRNEGIGSIEELIETIRRGRDAALEKKVLESLTTNETYFFRDVAPFEALRKVVLPDIIQRRQGERRICIWSLACATGQEAYSIAMVIREHFPQLASWDLKIIGADYSREVLEKAKSGTYSQFEVNRGLPVSYLLKYFIKEGDRWLLKDSVRTLTEFVEFNLLDSRYSLPTPDIVFLRNVMIYFDLETKKKILANVKNTMRRDGYLFLGTAETTLNIDNSLERHVFEDNCACYRIGQ